MGPRDVHCSFDRAQTSRCRLTANGPLPLVDRSNMGKPKNKADYILKSMQVEGMPRVFVLGCRAQRVTVHSQQTRAFNLVWALFEKKLLKVGDRVGVVGGGIGGLTVAAAAMLKGCKADVVEQSQTLMPLQRMNKTRLLHPNIYEWPDPVANNEKTSFPC